MSAAEITVGRNPSNTIHLARGSVSRFHAKIELSEDQYILTDLNSSNGTYINDQRIVRQRLRDGDTISFGNRSFIFSLCAPESEPAPSRPTTRFNPSDTVRFFGDDEGETHPEEVAARQASDASWTFAKPLPQDREIDPQEALQAHKRLSLLYQLSEDLRPMDSPDVMLARATDTLFEALPAERCVAILASAPDAPLEPKLIKYRSQQSHQDVIPLSRTVVNRVLRDKVAVLCSDALDDSRFKASESIRIHSLKSILCVPLLAGDKAFGALHLDTSQTLDAFDQNELEFAAAVANELAISIENRRLQQEAVRNERMAAIGLTITNVAHNIKNILLMNKGAEELMEMNVRRVSDPKIEKSWSLMRQCLERITGFASDMLNFTRVHPVDVRSTDINSAILANRHFFESSLAREGVQLRLDLQRDLPTWLMNVQGLQRALLNLVVNAAEAMDTPGVGEITLRTRITDQSELCISVSDNGCGIPIERIKDIFQLFYTTKSSHGTGLGLAMVQKFAENLGGKVAVDSQVGVGSTFNLIFPSPSLVLASQNSTRDETSGA